MSRTRGRRGTPPAPLLIILAAAAGWAAAASAADPPPPKGEPAQKFPPVTIVAVGNRLIVTSEDPQALALVQELVRTMTQARDEEFDLVVIPLKHANATVAARLLDELYNGSLQ